MKKLLVIITLILTVTMSGLCAVVEEGMLELGLLGSLDSDTSDGGTRCDLDASLGYFLLDNVQVGGLLKLEYDDLGTGWGFGPYGELNFDTYNAFMPYLALRVSLNLGNRFEHDHLLIDSAVGLKYFLTGSLAASTEVFYDLASDDVYAVKIKEDGRTSGRNHNVGLRLGLRYYF